MVKALPILHVKIAPVLPSLMGIVDGLRSSNLTINVHLGSSQDFNWATQEHLLSPPPKVKEVMFSPLSVCLFVCLCAGYLKQL